MAKEPEEVTPPKWEDIGADAVETDKQCKRMAEEAGNRPIEKPDPSPHFEDLHIKPRTYLIEKILPENELHLISGPSGSGKTTWLYGEFLPLWSQGKAIFGYESYPAPYVVVSMDRSLPSTHETLARLGVTGIPIVDGRKLRSIEEVIKKALDKVNEARLIVAEGLARIAPAGQRGDYASVSDFLVDSAVYAESKGLTLIGTVHQAKSHKGENYEDPRQRVSGSAAWAAMSDTIINIEREDAADPTNKFRLVNLLPRNAPDSQYRYSLDEKGKFVLVVEESTSELMELIVKELDDEFNFAELIADAKEAGVSRASACRWLEDTKLVSRVKRGWYKKVSL